MPIKNPYSSFAPPAEEPGLWERIGGLPGVVGTGIRGLSGVAASMGGWLGAGIAGAGEFGAELAEAIGGGPQPSLKRIGTEALLGSVPFAKVLKVGKPLVSAGLGALYGATGAGLRQQAQDQEFDPGAIATSGALAGLVTGGLSKFLPTPKSLPTPTPKPSTVTGTRFGVTPGTTGTGGWSEPIPTAPPVSTVTSKAATGEIMRDQRNLAAVERWSAKQASAAAKAEEDALAARQIEDAIAAGELETKAPSISESISTPIAGGRQRLTQRYAAPEAGEAELVTRTPIPPTSPAASMAPELPAVAAPAAVGAEVAEEPLSQFFRMAGGKLLPSRVDVAGQDYSELQNLFKVYGAGKSPDPAELQRIGEAARRGGIGLQREARAAGLPTKARAPIAPEVPPAVPDWVKEQTGLAEAGAESPDVLARIRQLAESEKGAVNPELLASLGLGIGGAALGAATDPFDDRFMSAVAGGAVGAVAPAALMKLGAAPETLRNLSENISTPEGLKATASKIFNTLPQIQRFNYLADVWGLPANAVVGPYGSAMMGALEHGLAGDPRGWAVMKSMNPVAFAQEYKGSLEEAAKLIGRAEGRPLSEAANLGETLLATPGTYMTAGDVAARRFLERAGFSADEARRITLTSEPELPAFKRLANVTKGSPLLQTLLPFTRTPANIGEQGAERIPGLGFLTQSMREAPDPIRQQLVQQGLSTAVAGGAGLLGASLDPEAAKIARRYVSNFGGQYSIPATVGFTAGQAIREGKPVVSTAALRGVSQSLPLPTTEPITEWVKFLSGEGRVPAGVMPRDVRDLLFPADTTPALSAIPRFKR